eukprot:7386318-Prymnesium_polylepis.1
MRMYSPREWLTVTHRRPACADARLGACRSRCPQPPILPNRADTCPVLFTRLEGVKPLVRV